MFKRQVFRKLSFGLLLLSVFSLVLVGCNPNRPSPDIDITDRNAPNPNEQPQTSPPPPPSNNGNQPNVEVPNTSNNVKFANIDYEPPLQKTEGIFYFTKSQHPPEVADPIHYETHNGWLIQLNDPAYKGHKIKVQEIKRSGTIYDITVRLEPGGDQRKPAYGFFEVAILDMPTYAKFRIYNDTGQKLWPKF